MRSLSRALVLVASVLGAFPASAAAASITTGFIQIMGATPHGSFELIGNDFTIAGSINNGHWGVSYECVHPCALHVFGITTGADFHRGTVVTPTASGPFGSVNDAAGEMYVTGPPLVIDAGPGVYLGPFSMSGTFCGHRRPTDPSGPACVTEILHVTGAGTVAATVRGETLTDGRNLYRVASATYLFAAPDSGGQTVPVPEPSTAVLVGSMLLVAYARRRRRRSS